MKRLYILASAAGAIATAALSSHTPAAQQATTAPFASYQDIPWHLRNGGGVTVRQAHQLGVANFRSNERLVTIDWSASAQTNQAPDYSLTPDFLTGGYVGYSVAHAQQEQVTRSFYPTACGPADDHSSLLVGGIRFDGGTVIERWSFEWPESMPQPTYNAQTGTTDVEVVLPLVTRSVVLSAPPSHGWQWVSSICGLVNETGTSTHALVQYQHPNDLVAMDLSDGSQALLVSETNTGAQLGTLAGLAAKDHSGVTRMERVSVGYVYVLSRGRVDIPVDQDTWEVPTLVFIDQDKNGTVDQALELSDADWQQQGWADWENYVTPWLD